MIRTGWQQVWVRILTTVLTICVMIMIYDFSRQNAERSDHTSGFISNAIISVLYPDYAAAFHRARSGNFTTFRKK